MAILKRKRWTCPKCGKGKLAPSRPRSDDVRTYCVPCSEATGRLVKRVCAANERKRERAKQRAAKKAMTKRRAKSRAARATRLRDQERRVRAGVDIPKFAARCWRRIRSSAHRRNILPSAPPELELRRGSKEGRTSGHAVSWKQRVTMTLGPMVDRVDVEVLTLHELCHCGSKDERLPDGRRAIHGRAFNLLLIDVARRMWGPDFDVGPGTDGGGYGPTHFIERTLRARNAEVAAMRKDS